MYDATDGMDGAVCTGVLTQADLLLPNTKCIETEDKFEVGHTPRTWEEKVVSVPAGVKQVSKTQLCIYVHSQIAQIFIVSQQRAPKGERNFGHVGISHVRFAKPDPANPTDGSKATDVC